MNTQKSILAKALNIAIFSSAIAATVTLIGCSEDQTTSENKAIETVEQQGTKLVRQASESLNASYAEMRAKQVNNVSYNLTVNIDNKSESFSGLFTELGATQLF